MTMMTFHVLNWMYICITQLKTLQSLKFMVLQLKLIESDDYHFGHINLYFDLCTIWINLKSVCPGQFITKLLET